MWCYRNQDKDHNDNDYVEATNPEVCIKYKYGDY